MDRLQQFFIFTEVAKRQSFSEVAHRLDLPRSTVTSAIQQLETHYGVRLFHRTTRKVSLTQDGQRILPECQNLLFDYEQLEQLIQTQKQHYRGTLKISMPSRIVHQVIIPELSDFYHRYPDIHLQLNSSDDMTDLIEKGIDCVVRVGELDSSSLIAKFIGHLVMVNCASADYLEQYGIPKQLEDLSQHKLINYAGAVGEKQGVFVYSGGTVMMDSALSVNNTEAYIAAANAGLGIIQLPYYDVQDKIEQGILVEVLSAYSAPSLPLNILYPNRSYIPKRLEVFMNWVGEVLNRKCIVIF
ncbi:MULTISPECIES: LysR family transcriptional regulator [Acinetobacter calcoaceticus/baumannii complex]|uniref:LysR family transcriptional regulator n=1 Tax=Acinetobacter calcoaceticus/baumannii complex TaxID=909768 RepID=UPI000449E465|nr:MULTISPECIES: LysR family transcriptional regulator [Acinetobacter calcoaceticus/baumannii complex]EXE77520.1 bacterial regulatory helix-turn-helix, lysR family protein [Acinetobacter sp. 1566109]MBR7750203.1 LysR family transcriptional regulator [Acinetobacter nosocomialis]MDO7214836.1 LysR family transcriptional regulator [Acinetobacter nosocomialis]HEM7451482.1 LysR family transcriptional regulator [Acinetobacter nosocomialis]